MSRRRGKSKDDFKPRETHSSASCFLLLLLIPFPRQGCLALSPGTVALRNKTNSPPPSFPPAFPSLPFSLPCTEEKAIKRESARLSVFIPSQRRLPGCYDNNALLDHYPESPFYSCLSLSVQMSGGTRAATHDRARVHEAFSSRPQSLCKL